MIRIIQDIYTEQENAIEALQQQTKFIRCPYCQAHNKDQLIDDYYELKPPRTGTMKISWTCDNCQGAYTTEHEINDDGCIVPPSPAVEWGCD